MTLSQSPSVAQKNHPEYLAKKLEAALNEEILRGPYTSSWRVCCDLNPHNITPEKWSELSGKYRIAFMDRNRFEVNGGEEFGLLLF